MTKKATKTVILAMRPGVVLELEKYGLLPVGHKGGKFEGCAKKWAKEGTPPYDDPKYQALAERLPTGWEELTLAEVNQIKKELAGLIKRKKDLPQDTPNLGSHAMLTNLTKVAFLAVAAVCGVLADKGYGMLPGDDEGEKKKAQEFSFETLLHLLIGSEMIKTVFMTIARTANTGTEYQEFLGEMLYLCALILAVFVASKRDEEKLKGLILSIKPALMRGMKLAEDFVSDRLVAKEIKGEDAERISLYLHKGRLSLEKEDLDDFYETFTECLGLMGVTPDKLHGDIKELGQFAEIVQNAFTTGMQKETEKISTLSQAM